jgi:hypothetical protein
MDSSVSPKEEIWFLRGCHHISNAVYQVHRGNGILTNNKQLIQAAALISTAAWISILLLQIAFPPCTCLTVKQACSSSVPLWTDSTLNYVESMRCENFSRNLPHFSTLATPVTVEFSVPVQTGPEAQNSLPLSGVPGGFPRVKRPGRGVDHPPPSNAKVKERVELYSPSVLLWPVTEKALPLPNYNESALTEARLAGATCMYRYEKWRVFEHSQRQFASNWLRQP